MHLSGWDLKLLVRNSDNEGFFCFNITNKKQQQQKQHDHSKYCTCNKRLNNLSAPRFLGVPGFSRLKEATTLWCQDPDRPVEIRSLYLLLHLTSAKEQCFLLCRSFSLYCRAGGLEDCWWTPKIQSHAQSEQPCLVNHYFTPNHILEIDIEEIINRLLICQLVLLISRATQTIQFLATRVIQVILYLYLKIL